jgi:hypothetical protein
MTRTGEAIFYSVSLGTAVVCMDLWLILHLAKSLKTGVLTTTSFTFRRRTNRLAFRYAFAWGVATVVVIAGLGGWVIVYLLKEAL